MVTDISATLCSTKKSTWHIIQIIYPCLLKVSSPSRTKERQNSRLHGVQCQKQLMITTQGKKVWKLVINLEKLCPWENDEKCEKIWRSLWTYRTIVCNWQTSRLSGSDGYTEIGRYQSADTRMAEFNLTLCFTHCTATLLQKYTTTEEEEGLLLH